MSVEEKQQAGSSSPGRSQPSAAGGDGAFRLGALAEEVVPLRGMEAADDEGDDLLARERAERVEVLVGGPRRVRLHIPKPNIRPSTRRRIALAGVGVALIAVLVASIDLAAGGGGGQRATERLAGEAKRTKTHLLARSGGPLPLRTSAAHTRRRGALAAKRKAARRRASRAKAHRQLPPQKSSGAAAAPSQTAGVEASPEEVPSSAEYTVEAPSEETYVPPPSAEAAPTPEETAGSEFDFERQQP